jgi:hypothetical protein
VEPLLSPLAQTKRIDLSTEECSPSLQLLGDDERIRQLLLNLVGNAIKFTPESGWVLLTCEKTGTWVNIRGRDNGPGIPLEKQQTIFNPFVQVDRRFNSPQEGVGLGLAISRCVRACLTLKVWPAFRRLQRLVGPQIGTDPPESLRLTNEYDHSSDAASAQWIMDRLPIRAARRRTREIIVDDPTPNKGEYAGSLRKAIGRHGKDILRQDH